MGLSAPLLSHVRPIADGPDGIADTLRTMAQITRVWVGSPLITRLGASILADAAVLPGDFYNAARAIHEWVRDNVDYVTDPPGVETVQTPEVTLAIGGDCDDKSILSAALYRSLANSPAVRFVASGFDGGDFEHVWSEVKIGSSWYGSDTTEPRPFGWKPPRSTVRQITWV